jgi:Carboxypeptidase regulatory-like domain/TonB-dependent Receptor Plug Domain
MKSGLTRNGSFVGLIWLVAMCVLLSVRLEAQSFYGSVVGNVLDNTQASVPDAAITITNVGTNDIQTTQSDSKGTFSFVNLVPAVYKMRVEKAGFKVFLSDQLTVEVGAVLRVDAALTVGDVNQTVQVTSESPLLQTDTSSVNTEISASQVAQLPLNGRNVMNLASLAPGVIANGAAGGAAGLDQNGGTRTAGGVGWGNFQIGGAIQGQSAFYIDGVPNNLLGGNILALVPTLDAVQEFSVVTSNATADFGRFAGGVVNMTTKSGGNAFHGGVWEYFRNAALNANDYFTNLAGEPRPEWNQNQYGAMVTGPIKKDKLFFMGSWERFKALTSIPNSTIVPTSAASRAKWGGSDEQDGIFANAIVDPTGNCTISTTANPGYWTITNLYGAGKNGGTCGDPLNKILKTYYPDPNQNPNSNGFDWFHASPLANLQNQYNGRIDWVTSPNNRFFGRYTYWTVSDTGHSEFGDQGLAGATWPLTDPSTNYKIHQAVLGDTFTLNPRTVLDVRVDFARLTNINPPKDTSVDYSQFGSTYEALSKQFTLDTLPNYALNGSHNFYNLSNCCKYNANWYDTYAINANVVKIVGQHSLKFGTELRLMDVTGTNYVGAAAGTYTYGTSFTGDEFAALLMGYPNGVQFQQYEPSAAYTYYQAYYASDTWQAGRNLTLNLGLRWELPGGIAERNNRTTVILPNALDPYTGITGTESLVASPLYHGRSVVVPQHNLFAPRVGFAYRVEANTVIHAGYGISYLPNDISGPNGLGTMPYNSIVNLSNTAVNVPSGAAPEQLQGILQGLVGGINQPIGRTEPDFMTKYASRSTFLGQTIEAPDPYQPGYPRVQQWNLDVSHQFTGDMMVEVAYSGLKGSNLPGIGNASTLSYPSLDELQSQYYSLADTTATTGTLAGKPNSGLTTVQPCANANGEVMSVGQCLRKFPYYSDFQDGAAFNSRQNYKSVFFKGIKRFGSAGSLMASYTWARNMSNTDTQNSWLESKATQQGGVGGGGVQDFNNLNGDYSLLSYDVENSLVVSYVLPLPFGKGQKFGNNLSGFGSILASGWAVDGITNFQSGFPLFISTGSDNLLTSTSGPGFGAGQLRPSVVPGCNPKIGGSGLARVKAGAWFNVNCFVWPTSGTDPAGLATFGNEPRVDPTLRQDGVKNFDFSFQKSTALHESANLEFRAEFYNIFNRVQFSGPIPVAPLSETSQTIIDTPAGLGGFGSVGYQFNKPRQIELSLRVNF